MKNEVDFTYRVSKDKKVFIFWHGNQAIVLKGKDSEKFLSRVADAGEDEAQMIMAKLAGNVKRLKRLRYLHNDRPLGGDS